jgi:hypothetical protein
MLSDVEILVINNSSKLVSKFKDNFDSNSASEILTTKLGSAAAATEDEKTSSKK